ncbi:MAG: FMN-binding negative transcriptional regulator [Bacteriovoracia bacterium]
MYVPKHFGPEDPAAVIEVIENFPFATLVTPGADGAPLANHVPIILEDRAAPKPKLLGHVARANPMWKALETSPRVLAIFHGPHAYISPRFYATNDRIPTWNYAVVQVRGRARLIQDAQKLEDLIVRLLERFEGEGLGRPHVKMEDDYSQKLLAGIVGFEIEAESIEHKFKLGQNRDPRDRESAIHSLEREGTEMDRQLAQWMRRFNPERGAR